MNQSAEFELFKSKLLEVLKSTLPGRNVDDHDIIFDQEKKDCFISFTFFLSEESDVDNFIRSVRTSLLKWPEISSHSDSNKFVYKVCKSHIQSHDYWDVSFWLADKYSFCEDSQS